MLYIQVRLKQTKIERKNQMNIVEIIANELNVKENERKIPKEPMKRFMLRDLPWTGLEELNLCRRNETGKDGFIH